MKTVLILNGLNLLTLGFIVALYFLFPPAVAIGFGIVWFVWVVISNYKLLLRPHNITADLMALGRAHRGLFYKQASALEACYDSIMAQEKTFMSQDNSAVQSAYELLRKKAESAVAAACRFMEQYDYVLCPHPAFLNGLVDECKELIKKSHELSDVLLRIDTEDYLDTGELDNLIDALNRMHDGVV